MNRLRRLGQLRLKVPTLPVLTVGVIFSILLLSRHPSPSLTPASLISSEAEIQEILVATPTPSPVLTPTATPTSVLSPVRIQIPAIKVDAPMSEVGVLPNGQVEEPSGPDEVAWTTGGARPGAMGNAILSGHFDWSTPVPRGAVFYRLRELEVGDEVTITLADAAELKYEVISNTLYLAATAPAEQILAQTPNEIITMITCEGTYNRALRDYSHRRVIVARRIYP